MKKLFVAAFACFIAFGAAAGVESAKGNGSNRAEACQSAKELAAAIIKAKRNTSVDRYGECSCSATASNGMTCTVDAYFK